MADNADANTLDASEAIACQLVANIAMTSERTSSTGPVLFNPAIVSMLRQSLGDIAAQEASLSNNKRQFGQHDNSGHHNQLLSRIPDNVIIKQEMDSSDTYINNMNAGHELSAEDDEEWQLLRDDQSKAKMQTQQSTSKYNKEDNSVVKPINAGKQLETQVKQVIVNLYHFLRQKNPIWSNQKVFKEISEGTLIGLRAVKATVYYSKKHGTIKEKVKTRIKAPKFVCSDEDRALIERYIYKMKNESRLKSIRELYKEMESSDQFNPSFKGCGLSTFSRIVVKAGFRITEHMIVNQRPSLADSETSKVDGFWLCSWPGCDRKFKDRKHLTEHTRTHTQEKPYECRQPGCDYRATQLGNMLKHLKTHNISTNRDNCIDKYE